jgi:predicted Ser/Thr protein kinase
MKMKSMVRLLKIKSNKRNILIIDFESEKFKNATKKFHKLFNVPVDEKLVTCAYLIIDLK